MSNKYHYVTAQPLGLASIHCRIGYFTSAVLQDTSTHLTFTYRCSPREGVGECVVSSTGPLRIMGIVGCESYVSHFEDRANQPTMYSRDHLVQPVLLRKSTTSLRTVEGGTALPSSQSAAGTNCQPGHMNQLHNPQYIFLEYPPTYYSPIYYMQQRPS